MPLEAMALRSTARTLILQRLAGRPMFHCQFLVLNPVSVQSNLWLGSPAAIKTGNLTSWHLNSHELAFILYSAQSRLPTILGYVWHWIR